MSYDDFTTFRVEIETAIAWVTFDFPPVNIQGLPMLADLNALAESLEQDRSVKVVVFQSANPEIFVAHADTDFLKDMSTSTVAREDVELLDLQSTSASAISKVPQATIAKLEGFARGGGHELALALRHALRRPRQGPVHADGGRHGHPALRWWRIPNGPAGGPGSRTGNRVGRPRL